VTRTNVPDIRVAYRYETLMDELVQIWWTSSSTEKFFGKFLFQGPMLWLFKYFRQKIRQKIGVFDSKQKLN
jgi:hypothetical protein